MRTTRRQGDEGHEDGGRDADDSILRWYPRSWRARYGHEVLALLDDEYAGRPPVRVRFGLVTGGIRQRTRQAGLTGDSVPPAEGIRAGALVILSAWTAFVIAGTSFAKFSEHFDQALPHSADSHRVPDLAYLVLQAAAGVASLLVVAGALLAVPAFVRFLRAGGWASARGHFWRALTSTGITAAMTGPMLVWAHHLSPQQRNGGLHWYGVLFLIWAMLNVVTLALWTVVAVAVARRVELSTAILTTEAALAGAVALAMVVMVAATAIWWGAMATDAPNFLSASPGGVAASHWDLWLVATVAVMALAMSTAAVGLLREVRGWTKVRMADRQF